MKYKTYTALAEAFNSGELSKDEWVLLLDNDSCRLSWCGTTPDGLDEDGEDNFEDQKYEEGKSIFMGEGYHDFKDACNAAGIPCDGC